MTEKLKSTLNKLGYPVSRLIYQGEAKTYFTFQTVLSKPISYSDDDSEGIEHTFRVNLFTREDFTDLLKLTLTTLKTDGFTISSVDPEDYENDTGLYHVPITIKIEED